MSIPTYEDYPKYIDLKSAQFKCKLYTKYYTSCSPKLTEI